MHSLYSVIPIIIFCLSASITPGPTNLMVMVSGQNFGIRKSISYASGMCLGNLFLFLLIGLSFGSAFMRFPLFHTSIKIIGAIYLLYLAWKIMTAHNAIKDGQNVKPMSFFNGILFQWVNPKIWTMAIAVFTTFTSVNLNIFQQIIIITLIFFFCSIIATSSWLCFGSRLKKILKKPSHQRYFNYLMGGLLTISVALIFLVTFPT